MGFIIGIDIGGSHITGAMLDTKKKTILKNSICRQDIQTEISAPKFIDSLAIIIENLKLITRNISGIAVSVPGPFDYKHGIFKIKGIGKYNKLFGLNLKQAILSFFKTKNQPTIVFINDATAYLKGEIEYKQFAEKRVLGITLGTGFGSSFFIDGNQIKNESVIPESGFLYNQPFQKTIADDYFSTRWFVKEYFKITGTRVHGVKELASIASSNPKAKKVFETFGQNLAEFLLPFIQDFDAEVLLIGGNIRKAKELFLMVIESSFQFFNRSIKICFAEQDENAAILGASSCFFSKDQKLSIHQNHWRKSEQYLLSKQKTRAKKGDYDIYPAHSLTPWKISSGFKQLAEVVKNHQLVIIDGYVGVFWDHFIQQLANELNRQNQVCKFYDVGSALKSQKDILELSAVAMGKMESIFGMKYTGELNDLFDKEKLELIKPDESGGGNIVYGFGASLANWAGLLVYVDVPKNEIQFRSRAGSINNLGLDHPLPSKEMYKRFYFFDWIVLNKHKEKLVSEIDVLVDEQQRDDIVFIDGRDFRESLAKMSESYFRVRPWFEPGPWGGSWMKNNIKGLAENVPNYAWSFELIVPENGLLLESSGKLLEFSFDFLMYAQAGKVLGDAYPVFKNEFPIRFDFLDTFDGGNLSVQCHPKPEYIKEHFGETFTQDETYYILDAKEGSEVYLGFQDDINPNKFRKELETSFVEKKEINIPQYVQVIPSKKHDLFLIPNGTIHASGKHNLVLEISSTPYIFTFKMYDWLRLDLDGNPRPINIEHAFNNLYFDRKGDKVKKELISTPILIEENSESKMYHLPTHKDHFYDVHRVEFEKEVEIETKNKCHICMLVEGESVLLETEKGASVRFNYAETFVIPAAAGKYKFINEGNGWAKLVKAFVKDNIRI